MNKIIFLFEINDNNSIKIILILKVKFLND